MYDTSVTPNSAYLKKVLTCHAPPAVLQVDKVQIQLWMHSMGRGGHAAFNRLRIVRSVATGEGDATPAFAFESRQGYRMNSTPPFAAPTDAPTDSQKSS